MSILDIILGMPKSASDDHLYFPKLRDDVWRQWLHQDAEDPASGEMADLVAGLYSALFHGSGEVDTNQRRRYSDALIHLCVFLEKRNVPAPLVNELWELGEALRELDRGVQRPFLQIQKSVGNQSDPGNVWYCRAVVASALEYLITKMGDKKQIAANVLAGRYAPLGSVIVRGDGDFAGAMKKWHRDFKAEDVRDANARSVFQNRLKMEEQYRKVGFVDRGIADKMMVDAMLWATRINDEAMRKLYPQVIKRAKSRLPY